MKLLRRVANRSLGLLLLWGWGPLPGYGCAGETNPGGTAADGFPPPAIVDSPSADTPASDTGSGGDGLSGRLTTLRVHYPLPAGKNLSARGSLAPLNWSSGATMTRKSADVFELTIRDLRVPSGGRLEWKPLVDDATWSRGQNYAVQPGQTVDIYPHFYNGAGRYLRHYTAFASTVLGNRRGVWLYLPPSFDENPGARYPVLYMHDGQNLFDPRYAFLGRTWRVAETLNAGIDALDPGSHLPEMVVVGPENTSDRIYEYTPTPGDDPRYPGGGGDKYLRFLVEELKPAIEADALLRGRLITDREHTALAGSSLGGLITAYAGITQRPVFGRLGIFSPSTWWDGRYLLGAVGTAAPGSPRWAAVYVDSGKPDDGYDDTFALAQKYRDGGYRDGIDLLYVAEPGGMHNEDAWARRLPAALRFLCAGW
ncbi:MAG TPA: alpha/beta hydrolase-fold protein [Pseudomonadota bacterium]|nr:alpha/beta hydrolase-fold protein [Pseudomonadota bacterium]